VYHLDIGITDGRNQKMHSPTGDIVINYSDVTSNWSSQVTDQHWIQYLLYLNRL